MSSAKFIVLTSSRTGSTWLIDLLNMQEGVEAHGELFLERRRQHPAIAGRDDFPRFIDAHDSPRFSRVPLVVSYLNRLYRSPNTVGFKLMYPQLRKNPEILFYTAIRRLRIVHLVRKNHIDAIVSEELARMTGASHTPAGVVTDVPKVYLNPESLVDRIQRRSRMPEQALRVLRLAACPHIQVTYESLLEEPQEFERLFRFLNLGFPPAHLESKLAKRGTRSHREAIANYHEIEKLLSSTPFASMLH